MEFNCESNCGLCCCNVEHIDELPSINGVCIHYNKELKNCSIYDTRPLICRVIEGFEVYGKGMTEEEYLLVNYLSCQEFKRKEENDRLV